MDDKPHTIHPDDFLRGDDAKEVTGWGEAGFRNARRRGLKVSYYGKHVWVLGADLIRFIRDQGKDSR